MTRSALSVAAMMLALPLCAQPGFAQTVSAGELTAASAPASAPAATPAASYRLSGDNSLRPVQIGDDGVHMYIQWSADQALPAVFAVNPQGGEEMVDGYMREGVFTVDRVYPELIFRIDKKSAKAVRTMAKRKG